MARLGRRRQAPGSFALGRARRQQSRILNRPGIQLLVVSP
jgi:hypothetical protein